MAALSTTTIKKRGDLEQRLAAADLVLPQQIPLCLKFSSDGEKQNVLSRTVYWGPQSLLYWMAIRVSHYSVNGSSRHRLIESISTN